MTRIKRGGRELIVNDSDVAGYLKQGYSVIDEKGHEITRGQAMTYEQAMKEIRELTQREKGLSKSLSDACGQNEKLKRENAELSAALEKEKAERQAEIDDLRKQIDKANASVQPETSGKGGSKK